MILLTGGSGLLGQELQKYITFDWIPSHEEFDITRDKLILLKHFDLIVHCAAYTDVAKAEIEKELCYKTNVIGTRNLAKFGIPMLYISTEYVFDGEKGNFGENDYPNPKNFYAFTKLLGEYETRINPKSVIIRCLFKRRPFEHDAGCIDQFTSGDYVDIIAQELVYTIEIFDKLPPILHIGTRKKSTYDLAKQSKPTIEKCRVKDITIVKLPKDTSLNTNLWKKIKNEYRFC